MLEISDELKDSVYQHIDQINDWNLDDFGQEEDVIDAAVDTLDNFSEPDGGQSAQIKAKKMHPSPKVDFPGPNWSGSTQAKSAADWIDSTGAELADLMFISNHFQGRQVESRRVMLSQMKFSSGGWQWKIKMHQYHLLHEMPEFLFTSPNTGAKFHIKPENKSFTTYSFASDHSWVFFNTTDKMRDLMKSTWGIKSTTYDPTPDEPYGFQVFRGIVKRFLLGMYGEEFELGDDISQMIVHMFDHASFERSDSSNTLADGGWTEEEDDPGTAVIQIDVGKEMQEPIFDEIDQEGPRI